MKRITVILIASLLLFLNNNIRAQQYDCEGEAGNLYVVEASSGLTLRDAPSLLSNKIMAVPFGKQITVCTNGPAVPETVEGKDGNWVQAYYRGKTGWMFDGYLKAESPIQVIHTDTWLSAGYPLDKEFLALYASNDNRFDPEFRLEAPNFHLDTLMGDENDPYITAQLAGPEQPVFLISGIKPLKTTGINGKKFDAKFLFPGETIYFGTDKASYYVYAKGNVVVNKSPADSKPFSMIRNYELRIRQVKGDRTTEEVLYRMDLPSWFGNGYEGGVFLEWLGDVDGDGQL
ncbi:MAG: SH3 domain-containing protein, partial [Bacteroidota bacterium]